MRRKDREVAPAEAVLEIVARCRVCHVAMFDAGAPYIVPLNFGHTYANGVLELYFHSAREGRKIDLLRRNPKVAFEMYNDLGLVEGKQPCAYGYAYESVMGAGTVHFLDDPAEKSAALDIFMAAMTGRPFHFDFPPEQLRAVAVYKLVADSFTGKRRPRPAE